MYNVFKRYLDICKVTFKYKTKNCLARLNYYNENVEVLNVNLPIHVVPTIYAQSIDLTLINW